MPKRKRDEDSEEVGRPPSAKQARVKHKLQVSTAKLAHAFKVAKGFERQKLGRRRKNLLAQKDEKSVRRIDGEVVALKALDTTTFAQSHLYKSLLKVKPISEHPDLPADVATAALPTADAATLNVHARLCKSKPVQDALSAALADVQRALGVADQEAALQKVRERAKLKGDVDSLAAGRKEGESESDWELGADSGSGNSNELDRKRRDALNAFDGRLASSSEDEEGHGDGFSVKDLEQRLAGEGIKHRNPKANEVTYDLAADMSISGSESESRSISPEAQKAPAPKKSSYIPSLTMTGYISGSGSDVDDIDIAPKKNRRGQRARQQIWEQKFGTKAKHLQQPSQSRSAGWDPKRGATDGSRGGFSKGRALSDHSVRARERNGNARTVGEGQKKSRDDGGPLHPSWEAAKKAKERKEKSVAFEGKKITFD